MEAIQYNGYKLNSLNIDIDLLRKNLFERVKMINYDLNRIKKTFIEMKRVNKQQKFRVNKKGHIQKIKNKLIKNKKPKKIESYDITKNIISILLILKQFQKIFHPIEIFPNDIILFIGSKIFDLLTYKFICDNDKCQLKWNKTILNNNLNTKEITKLRHCHGLKDKKCHKIILNGYKCIPCNRYFCSMCIKFTSPPVKCWDCCQNTEDLSDDELDDKIYLKYKSKQIILNSFLSLQKYLNQYFPLQKSNFNIILKNIIFSIYSPEFICNDNDCLNKWVKKIWKHNLNNEQRYMLYHCQGKIENKKCDYIGLHGIKCNDCEKIFCNDCIGYSIDYDGTINKFCNQCPDDYYSSDMDFISSNESDS